MALVLTPAGTIPKTSIARTVHIRQAMALGSDQFDIQYAGASEYLSADPSKLHTVKVGYTDPSTGERVPITVMDGYADEWTLSSSAGTTIGTAVKGRDRSALLTEHVIKRVYCLKPPAFTTLDPHYGFQGINGLPFVVGGAYRADTIAREVCRWYGLNMQWDIPFIPYTIKEDFPAVGKPLDVLRRLVAPYNYLDPFKVDIFVQKDTVIIRQRRPPFDPTQAFTISMHDLKVSNLHTRRRWLPVYNRVTILGATGGSATVLGQTVKDEDFETETTTEDETKWVTSRTTHKWTIRHPYNVTIHEEDETFVRNLSSNGMERASKKVVDWFYDVGDPGTVQVPNSNPTLWREKKTISGIQPGDEWGIFRELHTEETTYGYDPIMYQSVICTTIKDLDPQTLSWTKTGVTIKTVRQISNLISEQTVTRFKYDASTGATLFAGSESNTAAGVPAGGPRPPATAMVGGADSSNNQISYERYLSPVLGDPTRPFEPGDNVVVDLQLSDRHWLDVDLVHIMEDVKWASGKFAYEIELDLVACPTVTKGSLLYITGFVEVDGNVIPLQPALVDEVTMDYVENREESHLTSHIVARFWA